MASQEESDHKLIVTELTQAFRIVDKWSHDKDLNSVVSNNILSARYDLQSALENLTLTETEIKKREREEERVREEECAREEQEE